MVPVLGTKNNTMEISKLLELLKLADVEAIDENGNTALHLTVDNKTFTQKEMIDSLQILLDRGINTDIKNKNGAKVLDLAVVYRLKDVMDFLISRKINMDSVVHFFIEYEYKRFSKLAAEENTTDELASNIQRIENESAIYVEWLVSKGFDFDYKVDKKNSPLQTAIERNLQHILPLLLKCSENIHCNGEKNRTLLHSFLACSNPNIGSKSISKNWYSDRYAADIVKIFLDRRVSPDAEDGDKFTPALTAFKSKVDFKVMKMLIEQSTNINHKNYKHESLLQMVMKSFGFSNESEIEYHLKILHAIVAKGANVDELNKCNKYGQTALCHAVRQRNLEAIEFLQENGADFSVITKNGENLLHLLVNRDLMVGSNKIDEDTEITLLDLLISKGCQVNAKDKNGRTPLHEAVIHDNLAIVRKLIEHGAEVYHKTRDGETPLLIAAIKKYNPDIAKLLRKNGADVNVTTKNGETLIRHLLKSKEFMKKNVKSQIRLINSIMSKGYELNVKDESGTSLIHVAALHANVAIVRLLIKLGIDVNCRNNRRETPLHLVTTNSEAVNIAALLLERGANVNAKDSQGLTALHKIAKEPKSNESDMVSDKLLEYGADVEAKDVRGLTALDYARSRDVENYENKLRECMLSEIEDEDDYQDRLGDFYERMKEWASWTVVFLTRRATKLEAANLPRDNESKSWLGDYEMCAGSDYSDEQYYKDCLTEVEKLKETFIDDGISLYSLLHMNPSRRCAYVNNEKLQKLVQSPPKLKEQFPKYYVLILANYREANTRKSLLESAKEAWLEITEIDLPDLCLECIFSFLTNSDLFDMIEKY